MTSQKHIVIIGGGILGASTALRLSELIKKTSRPTRITLLEQSSPAGPHGVSGVSFAWINGAFKEPMLYELLNRLSLEHWTTFADLLVKRSGQDIDFRKGNSFHFTESETCAEKMRTKVIRSQSFGYNTRLVTKEEAQKLEPSLNLDNMITGIICEDEAVVDSFKATTACIYVARNNGVTILENFKVTKLCKATDGRINAVSGIQNYGTSREQTTELPCDTVIVAAGVGSAQILETAGVHLSLANAPGIMSITEHSVNTPILSNNILMYKECETMKYNIRQYGNGKVMICFGKAAPNSTQEKAEWLLKMMGQHVPQLKDSSIRISHIPTAFRPKSTDGKPIIGFSNEVPNLYVAVTHSGVTLAPLLSSLITIEVLEGTNVELLAHFRMSRFNKSKL